MSLPLPGHVYFDPNFKFLDGNVGRKLFVILCDSPVDERCVLVARTTSKPNSETIYGCYLDKYPPCFHLPKEISNFNDHTWIMLDYVLEYKRDGLESMSRTTDLSIEHTRDLLNCAGSSQYLDNWQISALQAQAAILA